MCPNKDRQTREIDDRLFTWRQRHGPLDPLALEHRARQARAEALRTLARSAVRWCHSLLLKHSPSGPGVNAPSVEAHVRDQKSKS
ncbi:RSP_7527 family protein [Mesorhizobium sp.]|uniref:RSP_7527 family protein n=1 Tax=Mesorhizobium sp. TaxID=1871066 RepID=UPI00268A6B72